MRRRREQTPLTVGGAQAGAPGAVILIVAAETLGGEVEPQKIRDGDICLSTMARLRLRLQSGPLFFNLPQIIAALRQRRFRLLRLLRLKALQS